MKSRSKNRAPPNLLEMGPSPASVRMGCGCQRQCGEIPCAVALKQRPRCRQGYGRISCGLRVVHIVVLAIALLCGDRAGASAVAPVAKKGISSIDILHVQTSSEGLLVHDPRQNMDGSNEDIDTKLQLAKQLSFRGKARKLMMVSTPMLVGGLGEGLVVLLTGYMLLFLTVCSIVSATFLSSLALVCPGDKNAQQRARNPSVRLYAPDDVCVHA